jgi:hypothetical protein
MSVQPREPFILGSGDHANIHVNAEPGSVLHWEVHAGKAVDAYLVDADQWAAFDANEEWECLQGQARRKDHFGSYRVPNEGPWTIVVINRANEDVPVWFDVSAED